MGKRHLVIPMKNARTRFSCTRTHLNYMAETLPFPTKQEIDGGLCLCHMILDDEFLHTKIEFAHFSLGWLKSTDQDHAINKF